MPSAVAETLGDARQLSRLGEPLRLSIPILADAGATLNERCLGVTWPSESDGLPHIMTARVGIEQQKNGMQLTVTTPGAVRDPVTRLMLRTTCDGETRVYTLFLEAPGSDRVIRAIPRAGPRLPAFSTGVSAPAAGSESAPADRGTTAPVATIIPVLPATGGMSSATPGARASLPPPPVAVSASPRTAAQPVAIASLDSSSSAIAMENANLKQQIADLGEELARLQNGNSASAATSPIAANTELPPPVTAPAVMPDNSSSSIARWNGGWPVAIALGGLASLGLGGFMWRRRHGSAAQEWALTGPPSHRVASRTSLSEQPVAFKQAGVRTDIDLQNDSTFPPAAQSASSEPHVPDQIFPQPAPATDTRSSSAGAQHEKVQAFGDPPPVSLLLQPSAEELGRDLEHELIIAERSHSALERSHPDLVELLTRSWGTATARGHLAAMLAGGSTDLNRMSGEAAGEVRLLLRVAEELSQQPSAVRPLLAMTPPAPVW